MLSIIATQVACLISSREREKEIIALPTEKKPWDRCNTVRARNEATNDICAHLYAHGPSTARELTASLKYAHPKSVINKLAQLEKQGFVEICGIDNLPYNPRVWQLTETGKQIAKDLGIKLKPSRRMQAQKQFRLTGNIGVVMALYHMPEYTGTPKQINAVIQYDTRGKLNSAMKRVRLKGYVEQIGTTGNFNEIVLRLTESGLFFARKTNEPIEL